MPKTNIALNNQYSNKYFEIAVIEKINGNMYFPNPIKYKETQNYKFSNKTIQLLNYDAKLCANYIGNNHKAVYSNGILLDDDIKVYIKRLFINQGLYYTTSVDYFKKFNFNFINYIQNFKISEIIKQFYPQVSINKDNINIVNKNTSLIIRHTNQKNYNKIKKVEAQMRLTFIQDLVTFFQKNPDQAQIFYTDMINQNNFSNNKQLINNNERLIVFNCITKKINEINFKNKENLESIIITGDDYSFYIDNLKIQINWLNGIGLNNPVIQVFLI